MSRSTSDGLGAGPAARSGPTAESVQLTAPAAATGILEAVEQGDSIALLVLVDDATDGAGGRGRRLLVAREWTRGTLGASDLDDPAVEAARAAIRGEGAEEGMVHLEDAEGRSFGVYLEVHHPQPELIVVGAGHIAQPLCTMGALLGFKVYVLDDRPEFATRERFPEAEEVVRVSFDDPFADHPVRRHSHLVLVTRGHKYDYECLRRVLHSDPQPAYIGMIGSRRRVRATWAQLVEEGISRQKIASVRAPVGLDLGAETPGEIAVAVAAEIVLMWRGGTGRPLREEEQVLERFFRELDEDDEEGTE